MFGLLYEFEGEVKLLEGKIKWKVVYFPYPVMEAFHTNGRVPVKLTVDGHEFDHTLLPSKNGHYFVYNEFIHRAVHKELGDNVHVALKKSEEIRSVAVPDFISRKLEDCGVLHVFLAQPDYLKREQINYIVLAKKEETKDNRVAALMNKLNKK